MAEETSEGVPPQLKDLLAKLAEKWAALPWERQQQILAHADTFFALVTSVELERVAEASTSIAESSERLVDLTDSLGWLTALLVAETAALILLTLYLVGR